jgi:hypothetical protein
MLARSTTITIMSTASEQGRDDQRIRRENSRSSRRSRRKPRRAAGAIAVHNYRNCSPTASESAPRMRLRAECEVRAAGPRGATAA